MTKKYKILITGAAGFLGSHLSERLTELGHTVVGIDNMIGGYKDNISNNIEFHDLDCCDFPKIKKIMKDVEVVYHCAATAHEGLSVFSPYEITRNNYLASVSIFSAAVNEKVKRIIFCSSMARYGKIKPPFESLSPANTLIILSIPDPPNADLSPQTASRSIIIADDTSPCTLACAKVVKRGRETSCVPPSKVTRTR